MRRLMSAPLVAAALCGSAAGALGEEAVSLKLKETRAALGVTQGALEALESDRQAIELQLGNLTEEVAALKSDLVAAAAEAQLQEDRLGAMEAELAGLEASRAARREALAERRQALGHSIAALQRLARTPPEALLVMPTSLREAHNTTILIGAVARELDLEAQFLRVELADLARLENAILAGRGEAERAAAQLQRQQAHLAALLSRKAELQSQTFAEHATAVAEMQALVERAGNLQELVDELGRLQAKERSAIARQQQIEKARETARAAEPAPPSAVSLADEEALLDAASRAGPEPDAGTEAVPETASEEGGERVVEGSDERSTLRVVKPPPVEIVEDASASADGETVLVAIPPRPEVRDVREARGAFVTPARGALVQKFGEDTSSGLAAKGIVIETRDNAQVVSPFSGKVVFSGPFRNYGQILIISHGEGYHTLLAGLGQIYARLGQAVLAGEPVGAMAADGGVRPRLYVELRQSSRPINPLPWLAAEGGIERG